jgi:hypothetical protein
MNVYKKLQEARVLLQNTKLNKSGNNKYAGFNYFELGDFIPQVTEIFNKIGLCGIVSFTNDTAYLTVHETEGDGFITFTSPLVYAENAKGQAIQSLGATHTYFRRYLWLMCMEITENDIVDSIEPKSPTEKKIESTTINVPKNDSKILITKAKGTIESSPKITGQAGEWQIVVPIKPLGDNSEWLDLVKTASHMLLDLTANEEDVMLIFKKNKSLFDTVKATDQAFFKEMMGKFTDKKNQFTTKE